MRLRRLTWLLLAAVVLLLAVPSATGFYTDWLWFKELGYEGVFLRTLNAQTLVFAASFVIVFVFLYLNLRLARGTGNRPHIVLGRDQAGRPITVESQSFARLAVPAALVLALILAFSSADDWLSWLSYFHAVPFGERDPLFGRDISFYVFRLPILQSVQGQAILVAFLALVGCGLLYVLSGSFVLEPRYGAGVLAPHAADAGGAPPSGAARGAHLRPARVGHLAADPADAADLAVGRVRRLVRRPARAHSVPARDGRRARARRRPRGLARLRPAGLAAAAWRSALYLVLWAGGGLYASFLQSFVVTPNEQNKERPFILNNIAATRRAYALDRVEERELSGDAELKDKDIINNASTIENVRLWDHQPLLADVRADPGDPDVLRLRVRSTTTAT